MSTRLIEPKTGPRRHVRPSPRIFVVPEPLLAQSKPIAKAFTHYQEMRVGWIEARKAIDAAGSDVLTAMEADRRRLGDWIAGSKEGAEPGDEAEYQARLGVDKAQRREAAHREVLETATDELERVVRAETGKTLEQLQSLEAEQVTATLAALAAFAEAVAELQALRFSATWIQGFPRFGARAPAPLALAEVAAWPKVEEALRSAIDPPPPEPDVVEVTGELEDTPESEETA